MEGIQSVPDQQRKIDLEKNDCSLGQMRIRNYPNTHYLTHWRRLFKILGEILGGKSGKNL